MPDRLNENPVSEASMITILSLTVRSVIVLPLSPASCRGTYRCPPRQPIEAQHVVQSIDKSLFNMNVWLLTGLE